MEAYQKNQKHKLTRRAGPNQKGKVCRGKCGERLTFKSFVANGYKPDGLKEHCKDCEKAYRQDRKETYKGSRERYRLLAGNRRTFRTLGWTGRYKELLETGKVTPPGRKKALKNKAKLRLVCGQLRIVG